MHRSHPLSHNLGILKILKSEEKEFKRKATEKRNCHKKEETCIQQSSFLNVSTMCAVESVNNNSLLEQVEITHFLSLRSKTMALNGKLNRSWLILHKMTKREKNVHIKPVLSFLKWCLLNLWIGGLAVKIKPRDK